MAIWRCVIFNIGSITGGTHGFSQDGRTMDSSEFQAQQWLSRIPRVCKGSVLNLCALKLLFYRYSLNNSCWNDEMDGFSLFLNQKSSMLDYWSICQFLYSSMFTLMWWVSRWDKQKDRGGGPSHSQLRRPKSDQIRPKFPKGSPIWEKFQKKTILLVASLTLMWWVPRWDRQKPVSASSRLPFCGIEGHLCSISPLQVKVISLIKRVWPPVYVDQPQYSWTHLLLPSPKESWSLTVTAWQEVLVFKQAIKWGRQGLTLADSGKWPSVS